MNGEQEVHCVLILNRKLLLMKNLLFVVFALLQFVCRAEYDSTYVLAVAQKYAIPENVSNGDYVGTWLKTYTWSPSGTISFSIEQNFNSAFSINSSSGLITISDATKINGKVVQQDTLINLIIRTTDAGVGYELDTAKIWVKENAYCVFIDYSQGTNGSGTRLSPEKDLDDLTFAAGYGYFLKRGVSINNPTSVIIQLVATEAHPTIFAAYGTGSKPRFEGGGTTNVGLYIGSQSNPDGEKSEYLHFYDLVLRNYGSVACKTWRPSRNISWYNFEDYLSGISAGQPVFSLNDQTYADSLGSYQMEFINYLSDSCYETSIKGGVGPLKVQNAWVRGRIRFCCGNDGILKHGYINNTVGSGASVQVRGDRIRIEDVYIYNSGSTGIELTSAGSASGMIGMPDNCVIKNALIRNSGGSSITLWATDSSQPDPSGNVIEDCLIDNSGTNGVRANSTNGLIVRRNHIKSAASYGMYFYSGSANYLIDNTDIHYNVIYGSGTYDIYCQDDVGYELYNNTVDGSINLTGATTETVRNNYFKSLTSADTASNNLDIDTLTTANHFQDYAGHDYRLKSTAISSIDNGYNVSLSSDMIGTSVPQGSAPDIGAYEYGTENIVTISATDANATEAGETTGTFRVSRGSETAGNLTVNFSTGGTATLNTDYTLSSSGSVTISNGNTYEDITLTPDDDATDEDDETAILTLSSGSGYTIGSPSSGTVTIADNDDPSSYEDMIAFWAFEEGSGTTAQDSTDNNHDGTLTNGAAFNADEKYGAYSIYLDGTDDYMNAGTIDLGNQFTVSLWTKIPSSGINDLQTLVANTASGSTQNGMKIYVNSYLTTDRAIIVETANGTTGNYASTGTNVFALDQWNHIAVTMDKTNGKALIYYNGTKVSSDSLIRNDFGTNQTVNLGQMTSNNARMKGYLDDVRIYDHLLTASEIDELANGTSSPTVTISATDANATEAGETTGTFRVSRGSETAGNLTVNFSTGGTATLNTDYTLSSSGSVTISNGNTYEDITLTPDDDATDEDDETAILTLSSGSGYTIGSPSSGTVTIADNDGYVGPIAHWKFEQNGLDETDNNHDATLYGSPVYVTGADGYGISLNASDRYANCGTINLGSAFSITGWYKFTGTTIRALAVNTSYSSPNGFYLNINGSNGEFKFVTGNGSSTLTATSTTGNHTNGTWIHFAVVVDKTAGTCNFYVNGASETSNSAIRTDFATNAGILLGRTTDNTYKLYGSLDDVRLYDYQLTESDISDIYNLLKSAKVTTGAFDQVDSGITVFPVPCADFLTINGSTEIRQIVLVNLLGQPVVKQNNTGASNIRVDISSLKSGYYCLKLVDSSGKITSKSIVKR